MEDLRLSFFALGFSVLISSTVDTAYPVAGPTNESGGYHAESYPPDDYPVEPSSPQSRSDQSGGSGGVYALTQYLNPLGYFGQGTSGADKSGSGGSSSSGGGSSSHDPSYTSGGSSGYGSDPHQPQNPHDPGYKPPGADSKHGSGAPNVNLQVGLPSIGLQYSPPPPLQSMDPKYGPPQGMDPKYGPPQGMDPKYGPPPPGMDSTFGLPPPTPGLDSKYNPPVPNMDPQYGQTSINYGSHTGPDPNPH